MKKILTMLLLTATVFGCRKTSFETQVPQTATNEMQHKTIFGQTLAAALLKEPALRHFIRIRSLEKFDNDHDVLYQAVKNEPVANGRTFYDVLVAHTGSRENLDAAINALPLLTIFVPTLPNWSPDTWNTDGDEVPWVAIEPDQTDASSKTISLYNASGEKKEIGFNLVPGFPVLVIKNNERVSIDGSVLDVSSQYTNGKEERVHYKTIDGQSYSFNARVFDGVHRNTNEATRTGLINPTYGFYAIDKVNVDAFYSGTEWHRDYVYYGITPTNPSGPLRRNFHEFIRSFKFLNPADLDVVADDTFDPKPDKLRSSSDPMWIDGNFEFYIDVLINASNGTGMILHKSFVCKGSDLFDLTYTPLKVFWATFYTLSTVTPKTYDPNIDLVPWDLQNYGNAWKFIVLEYDVSATTTKTVVHTSTRAGNFEFSISFGDSIKIGPKFGGSATSTTTTTNTLTYTTGSDQLSEGILAFDYHIITSIVDHSSIFLPAGYKRFTTYDVTTGRVALSVEPKQVW